ncbi:5'/3'-nucleotidase SurE [Christensenellaceae bacterium OttesenSCG-928-K19]|nr:5'/3'-nucleotidase SurE [Christensenellaceae bacterium OttesenSCG-928-K19]
MNIVLTNDDGIHALGIMTLAKRLSREHNVVVVAPESERSACSHSITLGQPLSVKEVHVSDYDGIEAYSVNGTPADCVKLATSALLEDKIDLVLSGINLGANLGTDIAYSGTVNAALEGAICGYPAVALSQRIDSPAAASSLREMFEQSAELTAQMIGQIDYTLLEDCIYNINFPAVEKEEIKGVKVCGQGISSYNSEFQKQNDPFGREFYWLCAVDNNSGYNEKNQTDVWWSKQNYITLTPLAWNDTCLPVLERAKCKSEDIKLRF